MLRFLHPTLDWDSVQAVGFDLDGTLYDEYEFIAQVYRPVAENIALAAGWDLEATYNRLLQRWLEKGSSYNRIFEEVLVDAGVPLAETHRAVAQSLLDFRSFRPELRLPPRVVKTLDWLSSRYPLFLVTDGGEPLQLAKVESLRLSRWFNLSNISISGSVGQGISKPDPRMLATVELFQSPQVTPRNVVFFGDRAVDGAFADNCGFQFVQVKIMLPVATTCGTGQ